MERRRFLKSVLFGAATAVTLPALQSKQLFLSALAADKLVKLDPKDPMAVALGYSENADKVDTKKWPKRAGAEGKTQYCNNCMFFSNPNGGRGACQIFAGKSVAAKGWCNSWSKKA